VAVRLETVEEVGGGGEVVDVCLFDAWRCELSIQNLIESGGCEPGLPIVMAPRMIGNLILRGETWC
jgi:hypothetical protein